MTDVPCIRFRWLKVSGKIIGRQAERVFDDARGTLLRILRGVAALYPILLLAAALSVTDPNQPCEVVPAEFRADRIFVHAPTPGGAITFYADTGGGWNAIRASVASRLGLVPSGKVETESGFVGSVDFPAFLTAAGIPRPFNEAWLHGRLVVVPDEQLQEDGFFGSRWFAGRVWEINYLDKSLCVLQRWHSSTDAHRATLGFRSNKGRRDLNFPRIAVTVSGEVFQVLLDTGATAQLTRSSAPEFSVEPGTKVGTSYITTSTFDRWVRLHSDWNVVEDAEIVTGHSYPMIRVPEVTIAGLTAGPIWFAARPDSTFENWMSQMTDQPIVGAIGGSVLKYFKVVVDYPGSAAYFWSTTRRVSSE